LINKRDSLDTFVEEILLMFNVQIRLRMPGFIENKEIVIY